MDLVAALVIVVVVVVVGLLIAWHAFLPMAVEHLAGKAIARLDRAVSIRVGCRQPPAEGAGKDWQ